MDFAFAPGATKYDGIMRKMYGFRSSTTVVNKTGVNSIKDFFDDLSKTVTTPLTNILIGTHGNETGWMNVQLDPAFDAHTTFEALEKAFAAVPRSCQLVAKIIDPRPVDSNNNPIDGFLFIRGCRIGVMTPFIQKLKDVINGLSVASIGVCAPKFYHVVYELTQGVFEGFNYDFHIFSKTSIATKADLVAQFDALSPKLKDIFGTDITTAQWNKWIPDDITKDKDPLIRVKLNPAPITRMPTIRAGRYKYKLATVLTLTMDPSVGALPTDAAGIATLLKSQLNTLAANPGTNPFGLQIQSTHPFPLFKRYEYNTIDEWVDGLKWTLNARSRVYTGQRYEYYVSPPVINNNANDELFYNFYASPTGGATTSITFADDDSNYFNKV